MATATGTGTGTIELELRGGNAQLWACNDPEVFIEGSAGTGKTRAILEKLWYLADAYPGARILLTRLKRTKVTRSVLVTFEKFVVPPGHPCLRGATREHRQSYKVGNGSEFIVQGAEDIESIKSQEYDLIYWNEITEAPTHEPYEALHRALRSGPVPHPQLICDANPNRPNHWILKRCQRGLTRRLFTRMQDNPYMFDASTGLWTRAGDNYRKTLQHMTGLNYRRLFLGEWCAASGLLIPEYAENESLYQKPLPGLLPNGRRDWASLGIRWWVAGMDWGKTAPGSLQVFGIDGDRRVYHVAEIYQTGRSKDWWADRAVEIADEFRTPGIPFRAIIADAHEPDSIELFNRRFQARGYPGMCRAAEHDFEGNFGVVHDLFNPVNPRFFFVPGATRFGRDESLDEAGKPCGLQDELRELAYIDKVDKPQRAKDETPDPLLPNHAFDATLYPLGWAFLKDLASTVQHRYAPGTAGAILGHERKRKAAAAKRRW